MTGQLPLEGILVVSVEQAVAAPFATRKLADAGARVVKVERLEGDFARRYDRAVRGASSYFVWLNRGKESVALDIKDPTDAALLRRMVARADVFVQNLAPGAAQRAGFDTEELRERHPRLVTCDISGYGEVGPYARMKAYDNLVQSEVGLHAVTGCPDRPAKVGISLCDIGAGMHAYASIVEALFRRERTGRGAGLKVSLFSAMADWMAVPYLHTVYGVGAPRRSGLRHPSIAPYGEFRSADGDLVLISIQNRREWRRFCEVVLARPELVDDHRFRENVDRVAHRNELREEVEAVFRRHSTEVLESRLRDGDIAYGRLRSVEELAVHPQLRTRKIETGHGAVQVPSDPVEWAGRGPPPPLRVPEVGEGTDACRREFAEVPPDLAPPPAEGSDE